MKLCRTSVLVAAWGLAGALAGPVGLPAQTTGVPFQVAVDAFGNQIGQVVRVDLSLDRMQVAMEVEGEQIFVLVYRDAFSHAAHPVVYFESSDCSGPAYMTRSPEETTFGAAAAVAGPDGTLYLGNPLTLQSRILGSALWSTRCEPVTATMPVIDATRNMDLKSRFASPYRLVSVPPPTATP